MSKPEWVIVALGEDVSAFAGEPYTDQFNEVSDRFKELTGADEVTQLRRTMDGVFQAYLWRDSESLGYFVLYQEE